MLPYGTQKQDGRPDHFFAYIPLVWLSPDGAAVRWQKWTERLENAFVAFDITNGAWKKVLMLTYAGNADLNDIVDTFSEEDLTPGEGETHYKTCVE